MTRVLLILAAVLCLKGTAYAVVGVSDEGQWPENWPQELEPLRKQSRSLVGPDAGSRHYAIRFDDRTSFEAAWPHLLTVKSKGAPIFLTRRPNSYLGDDSRVGVVIHCPPVRQWENPETPEAPIEGFKNPRVRWMFTNYVELVVDGEIMDLNRIPLPADTPIVDERFGDNAGRSVPAEKR